MNILDTFEYGMMDKILDSCIEHNKDEALIAYLAYDTCGPESPIRNCEAGNALYVAVLKNVLKMDAVLDDLNLSRELRDEVRNKLPEMMKASMKRHIKDFFAVLKGDSRETKLHRLCRGKQFLKDVMPNALVGTDVFRDPALESLRKKISFASSPGWDSVRFPIVFHMQWDDDDKTKSGKPRMLFHVTFDPWRTAVGIALCLCGPSPPIQIRETPYKDQKSAFQYQAPRKYIIDWDLYVQENLGKAGPMDMFTEDFLFDMFVRSLSVIHKYMRQLHVLPASKDLHMSIKSRTRKAMNKAGAMDTKCSYHATVHIMEPASRHKIIISKVLELVKKDKPFAYSIMMEKDGLKRGIPSPGRLQELGDYAGFMAMDTAMTNNWHQPVQSIGSTKGDGIMFKHRALVTFKPDQTYQISMTEEQYPDQYPLKMAMLIAQHSASIPDPYSIIYLPSSKWKFRMFENVDPLTALCMGSASRKRSWSSMISTPPPSSPLPMIHDTIPEWVMQGFTNAVHRATMGAAIFSTNNFSQIPSNMDERGMPEFARISDIKGTSFCIQNSPCIVSAALDSLVNVHKKNKSFIWVAKKCSKDGDKLVYMRCLDPECQNRAKKQGSPIFDRYGWALLDKKNMKVIDNI